MNLIFVVTLIWNLPDFIQAASGDSEIKLPGIIQKQNVIERSLQQKYGLQQNNEANSNADNLVTNGFKGTNEVKNNGISKFVARPSTRLYEMLIKGVIPYSKSELENWSLIQQRPHSEMAHFEPTGLGDFQNARRKWHQETINIRQKRSFSENNGKTLQKMHDALSALAANRNNAEHYNDLVVIIRRIQQQLEGHNLPTRNKMFLKNILKSFMKRRFNSWGGKRSSDKSSGFYPWGGKRKKSIGDTTYLQSRQTRRFSAWGGKRSDFGDNRMPDSLEVYGDNIGQNTVFDSPVSVDLIYDDSVQRTETGKHRTDLQNFLNSRKEADRTDILQLTDEPEIPNLETLYPADTLSVTEAFPTSLKRQSFNAWGGKRSEYDLLDSVEQDDQREIQEDDYKAEFDDITKGVADYGIKRARFSQWGGK